MSSSTSPSAAASDTLGIGTGGGGPNAGCIAGGAAADIGANENIMALPPGIPVSAVGSVSGDGGGAVGAVTGDGGGACGGACGISSSESE